MSRCLPSLLLLLTLSACTQEERPATRLDIRLQPPVPSTRALLPDETLISDYNLYIFNAQGFLEESVYVPARSLQTDGGVVHYRTELLREGPYTLLAAANLGYRLPFRNLDEALQYRYYMAYPDEYSRGIPMSAWQEGVSAGEEGIITLRLQRLMARIDLCIDRSALDPEIRFKVREVCVGGCPSSVLLFATSRAENSDQIFTNGFMHSGNEVNELNRELAPGRSGSISLYLLENCQGTLLHDVQSDRDKVLNDRYYSQVCAYLEIRAEYASPQWQTRPDERLIYRFYLGEDLDNFDVERNCLYRITLRPEGSGLNEESWRVEK